MELIVIQKLEFKLSTPTSLDFLKTVSNQQLMWQPMLVSVHVVLFPQFHELGVAKGVLSLPPGLSPDHHLCHLALCLETLVCNHCLMKFRVQPLHLPEHIRTGNLSKSVELHKIRNWAEFPASTKK